MGTVFWDYSGHYRFDSAKTRVIVRPVIRILPHSQPIGPEMDTTKGKKNVNGVMWGVAPEPVAKSWLGFHLGANY